LAKLRLAIEVLFAYGRAWRWMRRFEIEEAVRRLRGEAAPGRAVPVTDPLRLGAVVMGVLSVLPTDSRCLVRSLVLLSLLARREIANVLVIGVRTEPEFAAHAWIECGGQAVLPSGDGEFAPLIRV
jgi:Transglutaminase-like superfamily